MYGRSKYSNREYKGKSLLKWVDNYVLVDIETTGLSPRTDEIIEIGAIKVKDNKIVDTFDTLLKIDEYLSPFITNLTGITNKMLEEGAKQEEALEEFIEFAGNEIIMGHNVNFDINFIYDNLKDKLGLYLTNDFVDTLRLSRMLLSFLPRHRLDDLISYFNLETRNEHRALNDCLLTNQVYLKLCNLLVKVST